MRRAPGSILLLLTAPLLAAEPELVWQDPPREREPIELVFLAEGFRADERADFLASVRAQVRVLETHGASFVRADRAAYRLHAVFADSQGPCPARIGAPPGRTRFGLHRRPQDGLFESDDAALDATARRFVPGVHAVIAVVRFDQPVPLATADVPCQGSRVRLPEGHEATLVHELGHALFGLGDEYEAGHEAPTPAEAGLLAFYPNLSTDPSGARWAGGRPVEGGGGFARGVFRPEAACCMQNYTLPRFCRACSATIARGLSPRALDPPRLAARAARRVQVDVELPPGAERAFLVLLPDEGGDEAVLARARAVHERVAAGTRWVRPPEEPAGAEPWRSLEPQARTADFGRPPPGAWAVVGFAADARSLSAPALLRPARGGVIGGLR